MTDDERIAYLAGLDEEFNATDFDERADLDELRALLSDPAVWAEPDPGLGDRVTAAITEAAAAEGPRQPPATEGRPVPRRGGGAGRRRVDRRVLAGVAGLAAAAALAIGLSVGLNSGPTPETYRAALAGTPLAPGASARVTLVKTLSGWRITFHGTGLPRLDDGRYYEAWLKNAAGILVPIGTFNQPNDVILWSGVAPTQFPTLTVTRQEANGDPASSGQRVLTGTAHPAP